MRTTAHLAHQALLLHLAAELAQRLLELLLVLDDYLQAFTFSCLVATSGGRPTQDTQRPGAKSSRLSWFRFPVLGAGSLSAWLNAW